MHTKFVKTDKNAFETLFVANHNTKKVYKSIWVLDTGCSNHISSGKELFFKLDESFCTLMMLRDKTRILTIKKSRMVI